MGRGDALTAVEPMSYPGVSNMTTYEGLKTSRRSPSSFPRFAQVIRSLETPAPPPGLEANNPP